MVYKVIIGFLIVLISVSGIMCQEVTPEKYEATWNSLERHSIPQWLKDAKFGIYTHWGVYSVPAYGHNGTWYPHSMYTKGREQYQYHVKTYGPPSEFGYEDFVPMFKAEKFDADEWAELFKKSGAKFAGPVAEHHDGFAMWDSELTEWDAKEKGPKKDIVGELEEAIKKRGMKFVTTFHHDRWWSYYENSYGEDYGTGKRCDTENPEYTGIGKIFPPVHEKGAPPSAEAMKYWAGKYKEVVDKYKPDLLWFEGCFDVRCFREHLGEAEKHMQRFLAYYFNKAKEWNKEVEVTYKQHDLPPGVGMNDLELGRMAELTYHMWITDTSIDDQGAWSYVQNLGYKSVNRLVDNLVDRVSKNGLLLLNVGPKADGTIPEPAKERLLGMGEWLEVNGDAIYGTRAWTTYGEGPTKMKKGGQFIERSEKVHYTAEDIRFTVKGDFLYAICLAWPGEEVTIKTLRSYASTINSIEMLGVDEELKWSVNDEGLTIKTPDQKPCEHAYVFKISRVFKTIRK